MAKHRKSGGRKSSKFFAYPIEVDVTLSTLGAGVVTSGAMTALGVTKAYCISADVTWSIDGLTEDEGPLRVGLFNGNLSNTEVSEKLDARPTSQSDIIAMERSRRPVRPAGKFAGNETNEVLNEGKSIRTKLGFIIDEGVELEAYVRNDGSGALTTGAIAHASGTLYMKWI